MMPHARTFVAVVALGLVLGACAGRKTEITGSVLPDYRERHPIVLTEAPRSLEIYAGTRQLDPRQSSDIAAFAAEYRAHGRSQIIAEVPTYDGRSTAGHHGLHAVRSALSHNGIAGPVVQVRGYPAPDHTIAAPIRLSFAKLQAQVPHSCGHWPEDLGTSNWRVWAQNTSYWNFGCATQNNLAAFVADPLDLERGRPEGRIDTVRRMTAIEKLRAGQDPSTTYRDAATRLNQSVGN
jgi:pilus assembly protein CpaD